MIRRLNDIIWAFLIHAHLPPKFWVEALHTAAHLHNILPSKQLKFHTRTFALFRRHPTYTHLRVFGCACYPNISAIQLNKLQPRSKRCIFLGYPNQFRGYRCLDPETGKVYLSRHVTFDESIFPYNDTSTDHLYTFLNDELPPFVTHHSLNYNPQPTHPTATLSPTTPPPHHPTPRSSPPHLRPNLSPLNTPFKPG